MQPSSSPPRDAPTARRRLVGDASALVTGSVVNGLAAFGFAALGTRTYGAAAFAPISVVWALWALATAVLTFPVQHWIIRTVTAEGGEASVARQLPRLAVVGLGASLAFAVVAAFWRERLFGSESLLWPALVLAVGAGSAVMGYLRGILAGRRRFAATGTAIAAENLLRLAAAMVVVAVGASVGWFGAMLAVGPLVIFCWPSALRIGTDGRPAAHRLFEFLAGLGGALLLSQVALNAGPAVLAALGGVPASVTALFASIALFRAPFLIAIGLAARATGPLTRLVVGGDEARLGALRRATALFALAGSVLACGFGWLVGPALIDFIFGSGVAPSRTVVALVASGSVLALTALAAMLLLVARGAIRAVLASWAVSIAAGTIVLFLVPLDPIEAVATAFLVAEVVATAGLLLCDRNVAGTGAPAPATGVPA